MCLTSLVLKLQRWKASGAKRFHGKPPLIGLGAPRRSGGGRVQTFAIIRFLFGRALRPRRAERDPRDANFHTELARTLNIAVLPAKQAFSCPVSNGWSRANVSREF